MQRVHLKISGRVQGVFFRANTQKEAIKLGLKGWVRNTENGGVETVAQGTKEKLEAFIAWCHKGPPRAIVDNIDVSWEETEETFGSFGIRY